SAGLQCPMAKLLRSFGSSAPNFMSLLFDYAAPTHPMNLNIFLAEGLLPNWGTTTIIVAGVAGLILVVVIFMAIWAGRYIKVGPNEVLVVSGRKHSYTDPDGTVQTRGFRLRKGGGTFVIPVI